MTISRRLTDGPTATGTRVLGGVAMGPMTLKWTYEVTDFDPRRGMEFRTISKSSIGMDGSYRLSPNGTGTRVDADIQVRTRGFLRLLEPIVAGEIRRNESAELDRLKALLEGDPAQSSVAVPTAV